MPMLRSASTAISPGLLTAKRPRTVIAIPIVSRSKRQHASRFGLTTVMQSC